MRIEDEGVWKGTLLMFSLSFPLFLSILVFPHVSGQR